MVDWGIAQRIAVGVSGDPGLPQLPGDLAELCADAERRVVPYPKLQPTSPLPAPEAVDRPGWSQANLAGMRGVIEPVTDRIGADLGPLRDPIRSAAGLVIAAELGGVVGLMAQRVLGQYEVAPLDPDGPARLLFVAPNLREAARRLEADEAALGRPARGHARRAVLLRRVAAQARLRSPARAARRARGALRRPRGRTPRRHDAAARNPRAPARRGPDGGDARLRAPRPDGSGPGDHGADRRPRRARHGRRRRRHRAEPRGTPRRAGTPPARAPADHAAARTVAGPRDEAAPVRGGQALLRRGRRARGSGRAQPRVHRP